MMSYNTSTNLYVRALYSVGFSSLLMSFFKTNLVFRFIPYDGVDNKGLPKLNRTMFLSTSVNYDSAAFLYLAAMSILDGKEEEIEAVLQCSNNTTLLFEYKPDENNQMASYLVINKNNQTIPFRFLTHQFQVRENGRWVTKVVQSGLGVFAKVLNGYLTGIGADLHLSKLTEEELDNQQ